MKLTIEPYDPLRSRRAERQTIIVLLALAALGGWLVMKVLGVV